MTNFILGIPLKEPGLSIALLLLRAASGILMLTHGLSKWQDFEVLSVAFPDPIGLGGKLSFMLAIATEIIASGLLIAGLFTRLSLLPLSFTMLVAFFIVHKSDPFDLKELSLIYLLIFIFLFITGPGKYSMDFLISFIKKKAITKSV